MLYTVLILVTKWLVSLRVCTQYLHATEFFFTLQVDLQRKLDERNRLLGEYKVRNALQVTSCE